MVGRAGKLSAEGLVGWLIELHFEGSREREKTVAIVLGTKPKKGSSTQHELLVQDGGGQVSKQTMELDRKGTGHGQVFTTLVKVSPEELFEAQQGKFPLGVRANARTDTKSPLFAHGDADPDEDGDDNSDGGREQQL